MEGLSGRYCLQQVDILMRCFTFFLPFIVPYIVNGYAK